VRVATGEGAPGTVLADEAVTGDGAERAEKLGALLRGASAPVVAFEVRGDTATQLALLGALPPRSHLILLESTLAGTRTDVDFYRLVHKKNATVHGVPWSDPCDASRCERGLRLLRGPITAGWRPNPTAVQARAGLDPAVDEGNLLLLVWPEN
jgi:hypothetical protein